MRKNRGLCLLFLILSAFLGGCAAFTLLDMAVIGASAAIPIGGYMGAVNGAEDTKKEAQEIASDLKGKKVDYFCATGEAQKLYMTNTGSPTTNAFLRINPEERARIEKECSITKVNRKKKRFEEVMGSMECDGPPPICAMMKMMGKMGKND